METEEEDTRKKSILASVKEPQILESIADAQTDLGMNDAQSHLEEDASAVEPRESQVLAFVQDRIEDGNGAGAEGEGLLGGNEKEGADGDNESALSERAELVMDSAMIEEDRRDDDNNAAEENDTSLTRVQAPHGGTGEHDGVEISRQDNEIILEESEETSVDKHDALANYSGSDTAVAAETKGGATEMVEEVRVAAFTYDAVGGQVLFKDQSDDPNTAAQDMVDEGNKAVELAYILEEITVSRETANDDVQEQLDAAETVKIHEETDMSNSATTDDIKEGTMIEGSEKNNDRDENEVADAAGTDDVEVGATPEDREDEYEVSDAAGTDDVEVGATPEDGEDENEVSDAAETDDVEVGATPEDGEDENEVADAAMTYDVEVGVTPEDGEDENEEDASLEVEMNAGEDDTEVGEPADDMDSLQEETDAIEETDLMEEMEKEGEQSKTGAGQKRKRGRTPKGMTKVTQRKKIEEDVCFICYDGGGLVLCDRRACPKAYHPSCVNRDEAFFHTKGRWNCGWHQCSSCEKNANYMCYTCTFSLCKSCTKDSIIYCHKGKKGFCETCMRTIKLIEDNLKGNKNMNQVDFDDKGSWEYLFKDYYIDLKEKLSLTLEELLQAKSPWKGSDSFAGKQKSPDVDYNANDDKRTTDSENSSDDADVTAPKRRQAKRRSKFRSKESPAVGDDAEWASKELLEFVMHMTNGEKTFVSQYDIQFLLLDYIKRNNLRDPKRRGQIICDARFENLFGKPRIGHVEMLKLLESHYLIKEEADNEQGAVVDTDGNQLEVERNSYVSMKTTKDKKRKGRRKGDGRTPQSNLDDFAAIDTHNINLIYLRRNLLEYLLEDNNAFHDKVVGSFVRIRISGSNQKQDLYRLVPVVGTSKAGEPYKVGKRMTDYLLEILNLNKTEVISIDTLSNQEFTEMPSMPPEAHGDCRQYDTTGKILLCKEECKRLRQSIKCGIIDRLTVGDIHERAVVLQAARVKDWLEAETVRLSHLRDRASDLGRRKELRECVEKLQLLKTPEERQRRMNEMTEIHADPKMDPSYESEEDEMEEDDKRQDTYMRSRGSGGGFSGRGGKETVSPRKGGGYDSLRTQPRELTRNMSGKGYFSNNSAAYEIESSWSHARDRESQQQPSAREQRNAPEPTGPLRVGNSHNSYGNMMTGSVSRAVFETQAGSAGGTPTPTVQEVNETEKIWHYQDPTGKIQGPFSMTQLKKWNNTGYFPSGLRIWTSSENQEDSILLNDALNGNFQKDTASASRSQVGGTGKNTATAPSSAEVPKYATTGSGGGEWRSSSTNLPSPTPVSSKTNLLSSALNGGIIHAAATQSQAHHHHHQLPDPSHIPMANNPGAEVKLSTLNLQSLVQAVRNQTASVDTHGGGYNAAPVAKAAAEHPIPMPSAQQQPPQVQVGQWSSSSSTPAAAASASYVSYGSSGYANPWRTPSGLGGGDQPTTALSPAVSMNNWGGYGNPNNLSTAAAPDTPNATWVQQKVPASAGVWSGSVPQVHVQSPVNPGWVPPINVNPAFVAAGPQSSMNPNPSSWHAPGGGSQSTTWTGDQNPNPNGVGGYQGQRSTTRGESVGSYGGGGRSWNTNNQHRQGGGGGNLTRTPPGVCRFFFENGHCKKGASCNYRHN